VLFLDQRSGQSGSYPDDHTLTVMNIYRNKNSSAVRLQTQKFGFGFLTFTAFITVLPIIAIVVYIFIKGIPAISWEFLTTFPSNGVKEGGIYPAIVGTLLLTIGTAIFSVPLGIGAAIYLAEYASDNRWTRTIRIAIINLAGIPSVVYGLFGLGMFVIFLKFGTSILAGSLTLSIMTLPVIISTAEEALRAVPQSFRVVSISVGATRWQTIRKIVLPQALSGIITGVILGLERAAGETAPILFTAAAFFLPKLPSSLFDPTMALPYHLFVISTQVPGMPVEIQYGTALVLITFVLGMNLVATLIRSRARAHRQW
jgi:phosphate transport system permease protein